MLLLPLLLTAQELALSLLGSVHAQGCTLLEQRELCVCSVCVH
jgi:hypothetical protein